MPFVGKKRILLIENKLDSIVSAMNEKKLTIEEENTNNSSNLKFQSTQYNEIEMKKAAYALNLCTISVSQIIDYSDLNILEQEYDAILNNINIENMPKDEPLLKILERILDTITFFRIQEGNKKFIELEYKQKVKNAIWSAVPNIGLLFAGGDALTLAISLASQVGIGYMNYRRTKALNNLEHSKKIWELESNAIEQFNAVRRDLFNTAWRLAEKYNFPDSYRLSEKQIKQYNESLMDPDPVRKFQRLDDLKESFAAYPPFWFYYGSAANSIAQESLSKIKEYDNDEETNLNTNKEIFNSYKKIAINSYKRFFYENGDTEREDELKFNNANRYALLREDVIASSCAMEYAELLDEHDDNDKKKIEELYKIAEKYAPNEPDVQQLCAMGYLRIGKIKDVERILLKLINRNFNAITNSQLLSRLKVVDYIENTDSQQKKQCISEYELLSSRINPNFLFPWASNLKELEIASQDYIDRQKAILGKKALTVLGNIKKKYMFMFNRIIPVPYPTKYYPEDYFYDIEESYEKRKSDIKKILRSEKDCFDYCQALCSMDFGFELLEVMNQLLSEIKKLTDQDIEDYSFVNISDFENIVDLVSTEIHNNQEKIFNFTVYFRENLNEALQKFFSNKNESSKTQPWESHIDNLISISYSTLTNSLFEKILEIFYETISGIETMELISKADNKISNWATECNVEIPEDEFFVIEKPQEEESILKLDILGDDYKSHVVDREILETCKQRIQEEAFIKNRNHVQVYKEGGSHFRSYISRLNHKDKKFIGKDMSNIFAIIDDKSFVDTDLLFSLKGVYLKRANKILLISPYNDINWEDSEQTRIKIGDTTYKNKYVDLGYLVDLSKSYSKMINLTDEKKLANCEISDGKFSKLFLKLHKTSNTLNDAAKLMIANKNIVF